MTVVILVLAQLCFASLSIAGRIAYGELGIPPDAVVIVRMAFGLSIFFAWSQLRGERATLVSKEWRLLVLCGVLGTTLNQLLFLHGLVQLPKETAATTATLLGTTIPVFAAIFAVALGRERFSAKRALGIALALGGALALVDTSRLALSYDTLVGNLMIVCNCASYALFLVLVRPLATKVPPLRLTMWLFAVGVVCTTPLGVSAWADYAPHLSARAVGVLAFMVAVPTVGAYTLTQIGLRRAASSTVATYIYLQPVFATIGAVLLLGERPGPRIGVAAALIFAGVWVATRAQVAPGPAASELPKADAT